MDTKIVHSILETSPLFAVLSTEERILLQENASINAYSKHQVLYKPGHAANKVFFLLKGIVKIAVHAEKKDIIKYVVREGNFFGESCLTGDAHRRDFAYAMDEFVDRYAQQFCLRSIAAAFPRRTPSVHGKPIGKRGFEGFEEQNHGIFAPDGHRTGPPRRLRNTGQTQYDAPGHCRPYGHQPPDGNCRAQPTQTL